MLKCFQKLIDDVKACDDIVNHNYEPIIIQTDTVEDKMQEVYQKVRDIFGDNATVFINIHGDNTSTKVNYN
jgi:hypothetical protein